MGLGRCFLREREGKGGRLRGSMFERDGDGEGGLLEDAPLAGKLKGDVSKRQHSIVT